MDAGKRTINDIFNGNRVLEIPFFQRAYVWDEFQWERFLEDMELISVTNKPYFLGSVILKQNLTDSSASFGDIRTFIDGQQRLTTINIFFKVLCLKLDKNSSFERSFKLDNGQLALWHNHNDIQSFQRILGLNELVEISGRDNIIRSYHYFKENIDTDKIQYQTVLNNVMFVGIDLGADEDEQQIFDTINSLGVRLTTAELLKNYFFSRNDLADYKRYWMDVFEGDEDAKNYWDREITAGRLPRSFVDLFFYSYLQIKIQQPDLRVRAEDKIEFSKVEILFDSYKRLIKEYGLNKKDVLLEVKDYADLFRANFDYDIISQEIPREFGIERVNAIIFGLETSTLIPYVLYVLKNILDEQVRNELFEFLESYIIRRMVVRAINKNYNQFFSDRLISNQILSVNQLREYVKNNAEKVNYMPSDSELKKGFDESVLINKQAAGIIYLLESRIRDRKKQSTRLLGISSYSLEHIMPKKWRNKWASLMINEKQNYRDFKLKTLGNLSIITQSLNASIRDSDWSIKRSGREGKEGLRHFSAGIETMAPYLDCLEWNEAEIEKRAADLYDKAKDVWRFCL